MGLTDALTLALKMLAILAPSIQTIVSDWSSGKITAEEADAAANGEFTRMALALADPHAETAALDAATKAALEKKFARADAPKEEPTEKTEPTNFVEKLPANDNEKK